MVLKATIREYGIQEMIWSSIFDNVGVNKGVIEKIINDLNLVFGSLFYHQWLYVTLSIWL